MALTDKLIWGLTVALFSSFYIFDASVYSRFVLLGITVLIAGLILVKNNFRIPVYWHIFHTLILVFVIYCFVSSVWSIDPSASIVQGSIIAQILICMSVLYTYYLPQKSTTPLWRVVMWGGYIVTVYAFFYYGLDTIKTILSAAGRLDNTFSNVNSLGMVAALSVVITLYEILFGKFRWYHLLVILNIVLIAATGSRKAVMLLCGGCGGVVLIRYSNKNWLVSLVQYLVAFGILLFCLRLLLELPLLAGVRERFDTLFNLWRSTGEIDSSTFLRNWMIHIGWEQFLQHPLLGIGISASGAVLERVLWRTYFHNNYIEMLACGGIVGFWLYYQILFIAFFQLFRQRFCPDKNTLLGLILIVLILVLDIGAVSYGSKSTYFYLMILFIQIKINNRFLASKPTQTAGESCN